MAGRTLQASELIRRCDTGQFSFDTTDELDDLTEVIGQPRATAALRLAMGLRRPGYNVFAAGSQGSGRHATVRMFLDERAEDEAVPDDQCYVYGFTDHQVPAILRLPPGRGRVLAQDMRTWVEDLGAALQGAFEADQYRLRRQALDDELSRRQQQVLSRLQQEAQSRNLEMVQSAEGLSFVPRDENGPISEEDFAQLTPEQKQALAQNVSAVQKMSQDLLREAPGWDKDYRERVRQLERLVAEQTLGFLLQPPRETYKDLPQVTDYFDAVHADVVQNFRDMLSADTQGAPQQPDRARALARRYRVNVLVDQHGASGAPVVYLDNPTFPALVGRIENRAEMGALSPDFLLIRPGALHRANGGYLILDAHKVVSQPYAWEGLKRALRSGEIRCESLSQMQGAMNTVALDPEPMPLQVKVVLVGEHGLHRQLQQSDPDFDDLFKVTAEFDEEMERDGESETAYASLIATLGRRHDLLSFDRTGVARMVEYGSRVAADQAQLTTRVRDLAEVMTEASYRAAEAGSASVVSTHVQEAIEARLYRTGRIQQRMQEQILRGTVLVDTAGTRVGQINGLAVYQGSGQSFGRPSRITARIRMGDGSVVDIEREVELSGPSHSKGVLILSSFLAGRYAIDRPLSLSASLVFEQSYGGVDGDSASSAELYALLSAIAEVPIRQALAVTGSVNQLGQVQAIGGANEKIEGFFDVCQARGLSGDQGVLIPASNVQHLMLRDDIVQAVEDGRFHVYAVETIDEGIEWLTGVPAGEADADGVFDESTINGKVHRRLQALAERRQALTEAMRGKSN